VSNTKIIGFVAKLAEKTGTTGRGKPWVLYSCKIEKPDGTEYPDWYSFGFEKPKFAEGDYIEFDAVQDGKYWKFVEGSGKKPKNAPARAAKQQPSPAAGGKTGFAGRGGFTPRAEDPVRQRQIVEQHSQEMAARLLDTLLANKALPLSKADTKAGEALRYAEIIAAWKKLTVEAAQDIITGRLLASIADAGAVDGEQTDGDASVAEETEAVEETEAEADDGF
jgi:hypothetical protein